MIQANELRIGNWIFINGEYCQIGYAFISDLAQINKGIKNQYLNTINDVKPIPLTEEILLKCGFKIREITVLGANQKHYSDFRNIAIEILSDSYFMFGIHKGYDTIEPIRRVETLHQLQNLYFALTNTELNINL